MARKHTPRPLRGKATRVSVPLDLLDEIRREADRRGRSLVWICSRAVEVARELTNGDEAETA